MLEIMLVVTIIALLLAAAIKFMSPNVDIAKRVRVAGDIQAIKTSLLAYQGINGFYPTTEQGLQALVAKPDGVDRWQGPYLQKQVPGDPWGRAYKYKSPGDHSDYDLYSYGSDNAPGGVGEAQDVNSWETTATIKTQ